MDIEDRIKRRFPALYITLLSILIGLVFSDLASEAHTRMTLSPLNLGTLRTWGQIFAMATNALGAWVAFAHIGISRQRIPSLADSVIVFLVPVPLLFANALVGQRDIWPWFYYASGYLLIAYASWRWQVRMASKESELASFARLAHPLGAVSVLYVGIPFYAAAGWADQHGLLTPVVETMLAMSAAPASMIFSWLFFRDWHRAIAEAQNGGRAIQAVASAQC
jgi:hypothetical protein